MKKARMKVRVIVRDRYARIDQILEQEMPSDPHQVSLLMRRLPFRYVISRAVTNGGTVAIERVAVN